jgi:hypothetical protein
VIDSIGFDGGPADAPVATADAPFGTPDAPPRPDSPPGTPDARPRPDAPPRSDADTAAAPMVRFVNKAWWTNYNGTLYESSTGMSHDGMAISTSGVQNGDLLLFIASIDNGSDTLWPLLPGFTQLVQHEYGLDGETYVAQWKIANNEPSEYTGAYGPGLNSGSSALMLIDITNVNPSTPIDVFTSGDDPGSGTRPIVYGTSPGVTTTRAHDLVLYAAGVDWRGTPGSNTYTPPSGFTEVAVLGDHGTDGDWDWTSQQVASEVLDIPAATGTLTGSFTEDQTYTSQAWTVVIAISP